MSSTARVSPEASWLSRVGHGSSAPVIVMTEPAGSAATDLADEFGRHGWSCLVAHDVERVRWLASIQRTAAVVIAAPHTTEVANHLRGLTADVVVAVADLSARGLAEVLDAGVDAVIPGGAPPAEIVARVAALLRRGQGTATRGARFLVSGELVVDLDARLCEVGGRPVHLSPTEHQLLVFLMAHPQQTLTRDVIVRHVWGWATTSGGNVLRLTVKRLRAKLGDDVAAPTYIRAVRGLGYSFCPSVIEMGDGADPATASSGEVSLVEAVRTLSLAVSSARSERAAAEAVVTTVHASGYGDGVALFRRVDTRLELMTSAGMSDAWTTSMAQGVQLDGGYAAARAVGSGELVQLSDVQADARFPATARLASSEGYHAIVLLPVRIGDRTWGQLGMTRRSSRAFDAAATAYLSCAAGLLEAALTALD